MDVSTIKDFIFGIEILITWALRMYLPFCWGISLFANQMMANLHVWSRGFIDWCINLQWH